MKTVAFLTLSVALVACGGAAQESAKTTASVKPAQAQKAPDPKATPATLTRTSLRQTITEGMGAFLQNVDIDDHAVFADGKFHGFRVLALRDGLAGRGVEPGDVIVAVNKMPIERPEQALAVFRALETAPELRVDYERDGEPKTLTIPIVDDAKPSAN